MNNTHELALRIELVISSVGQADDTVLSANKMSNLANILIITQDYCEKYSVTLSSDKTKLLRITNLSENELEHMNPVVINGKQIEFSNSAEHVGIIRSIDGNLPHLMNRFSAHRKAMAATLFTGLAQKHRGNPIVGLRIEKIYGTPVLMSGVASLVLNSNEITLLDQHFKKTYQNLQKLFRNTPDCVVYFLGGCLPARAVLHIKQLSLFGMVTRLLDDALNIHARKILAEAKRSSKSWFTQIRDTCLQYNLPHPIVLLNNPPSKEQFKKMVKSNVISYWESKLRSEAEMLPSLVNFNSNFMSLTQPHPIWTSAKSNPHEVAKAVQQARFLSGRYRTESLVKHWSPGNSGMCQAEGCHQGNETVEHILLKCTAYTKSRRKLISMWLNTENVEAHRLVLEAFSSKTEHLLQFIIDCSTLPTVITSRQEHGEELINELFRLTRTWCFVIHHERMKMLGRWNG